ncbi:exopolysaccharide phosphotransferase CpsY [Lachnospiraceae bacterium]|nr:exopolysaccharide phosphotransferase CpsY [Lachnospiraceae bacterium]
MNRQSMRRKRENLDQGPIDIVIPWVDSNDPIWLAEKRKYQTYSNNEEDTRDIRFRDWDNLKYVFRSIEECAPWIRKVHFVTCGQIPKWMNLDNPKLHMVNHSDYIPDDYLPTFSSHVIELNMHRIPDLSEQFIYINDDIFFLRKLKPEDFFKNGLPCDVNISNLIVPSRVNFTPIVFKTVAYINKHFNKRENIISKPGQFINLKYGLSGLISFILFVRWKDYTGFYNHHVANSYLKSTLQTVWNEEPEILHETSSHMFRDNNDVNQYIFRFWQLASGNFCPNNLHGRYFKVSDNNRKIIDYLRKKKGRMICINDDEFQGDFEAVKHEINMELEKLYPYKSSYEK